MNIQTEKYALIEELMKIKDVDFVREIRSMIETNNEIVACEVDGKPITKAGMQADILAAKKRILSGQYTSQSDIEKEVKSW